MASEFDSRISQIQTSIERLTTSLKEVDSTLYEASRQFEAMASNAESINQVSSSVAKLESLVKRLENTPFAERLRAQVSAMNEELQRVDTSRLQTVTGAIQAQTQAQKALNQTQININGNFRKTKEIVDTMISSLGSLSQAAESLGTRTATSLESVTTSLGAMSAHEKQIQAVVGSLNALDPGRYTQTATALKEVADAVERISKAKLEGINVPTPRQPRQASTPGPTPSAIKYAQEQGIDLSKYEGQRVTMSQLRADTQKVPVAQQVAQSTNKDVVQQATERYNKFRDEALEADKAMLAINTARQKAFEASVAQYGVNPKLHAEFKDALVGKNKSKRYELANEYKSTFMDVEQSYEHKLSKESIDTSIKEFQTMAASDDAALAALMKYREALSRRGAQIKTALVGKGIESAEALPEFLRSSSDSYIANRLRGSRTETPGPYAGVQAESQYNAKLGAFETKGNGILGANAKETVANLDAINKALDASPHNIAIVTTTGGSLGGVSALGKEHDFADHVLTVYRDLNNELKILEMRPSLTPSAGNKTGVPFVGSENQGRRTVEDVASSYDRLRAVPLSYGSDDQAKKFINSLTEITAPKETYSFRTEKGAMSDLGQTCASAAAKALAESGLMTDLQQTLRPIAKNGINVQTPHDVLKTVADNNFRAQGISTETDVPMRSFIQKLGDSFRSIIDRLKSVFGELGEKVGKISLGDIGDYLKNSSSQSKALQLLGNTLQAQGEKASPAFLLGGAGSPSFGLGQSTSDALSFASKKIYRPLSYGLSQGGAILNSGIEISKGVQQGGAGGVLDVAGGIFKGLHALQNLNAYFGLNVLPKGIGNLFNERRSQTMMDIVETTVGLKTGYGRTPIDRNLGSLQSKEKFSAEALADKKQEYDKATASPEEMARMALEIQKDTEELKKLRQAINAYRTVLAQEAELEQQKNAAKNGPSTGATLAPGFALAKLPQSADAHIDRANAIVSRFMDEQSTALSAQAQGAFQKFSAGTGLETGLGGGLKLVPQDKVLELVKQFYGAEAIQGVDQKDVQGVSIPVKDENGKRVTSTIVATIQKGLVDGLTAAEVVIHEATHELAENIQRQGKELYTAVGDSFQFGDATTEALRSKRANELNPVLSPHTAMQRNNLLAGADTAGSEYTKGIHSGLGGGDIDAVAYMFDPREIYAHVGQALLSKSSDLEQTLVHVYGKDLFNRVVQDLKTEIPEVFSNASIATLKPRLGEFENSLSFLTAAQSAPVPLSAAPTAPVAIDPNSLAGKVQSALSEVFGSTFKKLDSSLEAALGDIPKYGQLLKDTVQPGGDSFARISEKAQDIYVPQGTAKRRLTDSLQAAGGTDLIKSLAEAVVNPTKQNIRAAFESARDVDIVQAIRSFIRRAFTEGTLDIPGGLIAKAAFSGKIPPEKVVGALAGQFLKPDVNFRDELNARVRDKTGKNIEMGSFSQQAVYDPVKNMTTYALSAKTADGATVSLNGHLDALGKKHIDQPGKDLSQMSMALKEFVSAIPRNLGYQLTYGITGAFQQMLRQLISVQDELSEISNLLGAVGDDATKAQSKFLFESVGTAVKTGQGFDEAIQTNLKNFKILGSVKDIDKRGQLANQISEVQLGAQTAFGVSLEQSLESIPSILSTIKDGMTGIDDPTEKVTASVTELKQVMDQVVAAQRATGASGDELLLVYSRLSASAKEYGLNSKQLLGITSTSSVAIGKGSEETSNVLRAFLEGTYSEANAGSFAKSGIATKSFNRDTNQVENRSFEKILEDLFKLSQDKSQNIQYNQLLQSIAGPKVKPDIAKVVSGFGKNYDQVSGQIDQSQEGTFQKLVGQKSQNIQGSLNKLQATGTEFLGSLLVGTGAFDNLSKIFDNLSESSLSLTKFLNDNGDTIKKVVTALTPFLKIFTIGQLTKDLNLSKPIVAGFEIVERKISGSAAKLVDLGQVGSGAGTELQRSLKLVNVVLEEMEFTAHRTGAAITTSFQQAAVAANNLNKNMSQPSFALTAGGALLEDDQALNTRLAGKQMKGRFSSNDLAQLRNNGQYANRPFAEFGQANRYIDEVANRDVAPQGQSSFFYKGGALARGIVGAGAVGGALAAPVGFDLLSGGFKKDNVTNVVGAGIAGAFIGAMTGPQGAIIGYTLAKSFLDTIDLPGLIGTSDKERGTLATAILNKGKTKEDVKPAEQRAQEQAQLNLGIKEFKAAIGFDKLLGSKVTVGNQSAELNKFQVSSQAIADYKRLIVEGDRSQTGDTVRAAIVDDSTTKAVYDALSQNKVALDSYIQAGVSSFTEFGQQINEASTGVGPLADKLKELGTNAQTARHTESLNIAKEADLKHEQLLLEASNDIIKRINENLSKFQNESAKLREVPFGLNQYGEFGTKTNAVDAQFKDKLDAIRSGKIKGPEAQRIEDQYEKSRSSVTALPQTLQSILPLAKDLGLNTKGLEKNLYGIGAEGQQQFTQRFSQANQADQFVQDYESKQKALKDYEGTAQYRARDEAIVKEHDTLQSALNLDKQRYLISKQYLDSIKAQKDILGDQTKEIEKQNQVRTLISAGTPATFNPLSTFDTKGLTSAQINKAIDAALAKQKQLEALSPGYKKYFADQQFLLQGKGGFKPVTGIDQGFVQEAIQSQQSQMAPPSMEDLSQFSDTQVQRILDRARGLQGQAVALNPDLAGKYDNERIMIYRKNNQLLQQTGLSQEYLKLAIQENTKSNDTLRGHYNLPSSYRAPTVWDYYDKGGKETGDVNFANKMGQGAMVPLSFAQQLATEMMNAVKGGNEGADLSGVTTTQGPGGKEKPTYYTGGSAPVYSEPAPIPLPDDVTAPRLPYVNPRDEIDAMKHANAVDARSKKATTTRDLHSYDDIENARNTRSKGQTSPLDLIKDALDRTKQSLGLTDEKVKILGAGAALTAATLTGFSGSAAVLAVNTNAFSGAVTSLLAKIQAFDIVRAMKAANITMQVTVNGQAAQATAPVITNTGGGGASTLTGAPAARTRLS